MTLYITGDGGARVAGSIQFFNAAGELVGTQPVPVAGVDLINQYLNAATNVVVSAPGYYEFGTPVHTLLEENEFQLVAKPSPVKYIIGGAIAFFALSQLLK